jgi:hypothetical protein
MNPFVLAFSCYSCKFNFNIIVGYCVSPMWVLSMCRETVTNIYCMYTAHTNFSLKICVLLVEEGLPLARFALRVCSSLSELSFYVSCGLSRFHSARVANTLFCRSVTAFLPKLLSTETRIVDTERGWLRCCGNVFIQPLPSIGLLLNCDWLALELMWTVPTNARIYACVLQTVYTYSLEMFRP